MTLRRVGYQRYAIVGGVADGTVIERATNPRALPCYRWCVVDGRWGWGSTRGHTLRGLAAEVERLAAVRRG